MVESFTATYNSLRLLMAICGIKTLSGPSTVVRRRPVEGLNVTRELAKLPSVTMAKAFVDEIISFGGARLCRHQPYNAEEIHYTSTRFDALHIG